MRKDLHNNPVVFWLLAAIAVGSFIFAIYTFEITKPSRNLVYRVYSKSFNIPDGMNNITIDTLEGNFHPTSGFIKELYIWNNGNLEIEPAYILQSIKIKFEETEKLIEVFGKNISGASFSVEFADKKVEIKFEKLLPKAGFVVRYFSSENVKSPQIEGLIADPIRGASPIKNASINFIDPQSERSVNWYWELFGILFYPLALSGSILGIQEVKPAGKLGKIIRNLILYPTTAMLILFVIVKSYDFLLARPPI